MTTTQLGELVEFTGPIDDRAALEEFFDEFGYLLLRGVFPVSVVEEIRVGVMRGLEAQGARFVGPELSRVELPDADIDVEMLHRFATYQVLWSDPHVLRFMKHIFGGPVFTWRFVTLRAKAAGVDKFRAVAHQDGFFFEREPLFRTFWSPLAPVEPAMGGVAVVPGSHRGGRLESVTSTETKMANVGGGGYRTIKAEDLPTEGWASGGLMEPGDLLIQHPFLVHEGMPNGSENGMARLSMDWRVQPARSYRTAASQFLLRDLLVKVDAGEMYIDDLGRYQFHEGFEPNLPLEPDRATAS